MKGVYHIDLSNKFWKKKATGIACIEAESKSHTGCALCNRLKRYIEKTLYSNKETEERAKLYAICIYYITKDIKDKIETLVICCDENFQLVKNGLEILWQKEGMPKRIISIMEFRAMLGRSLKSPADNYARVYAKRGMNKLKWNKGIKLNVVEITYAMIREKWEKIKKVSE